MDSDWPQPSLSFSRIIQHFTSKIGPIPSAFSDYQKIVKFVNKLKHWHGTITFSIMTFSITTLSSIKNMTLRITTHNTMTHNTVPQVSTSRCVS